MKKKKKTKINFTWQGKIEVEEVSTYKFFFFLGGGLHFFLGKLPFTPLKYDHFCVLASKVQKVTLNPHKLINCGKFAHPSTFSVFLDRMPVTCVASDF
jgi:hypothetical protein